MDRQHKMRALQDMDKDLKLKLVSFHICYPICNFSLSFLQFIASKIKHVQV